jgi:acetylornithine deacetylase/succinyl-diaminopimelate desuccinylase-like protein
MKIKLICFCLAVCLFCASFSFGEDKLDWAKADREVKDHLVNLININTSQPEGNEIKTARYIYKNLSRDEVDWDIFKFDEKRANVVAYLKSGSSLPPLIIMAHMDTEGANPNEWSVPPFKATLKDGYVYGRGAADAKNLVAINLEVMSLLKRQNVKLKRDLIMIASADEEEFGDKGTKWLLDKHWDKIKAGFALNEGGAIISSDDGQKKAVFVALAEKNYMDVRLIAKGPAIHPGMGIHNSAIQILVRALDRIGRYEFPYRLSDVTKSFFRSIYSLQTEDAKATIDMLLSSDGEKSRQAVNAISTDAFFNSQLRDSVVPTMISGGEDNNVISPTATAVLNCRLLPDTNPDEFLKTLEMIIDDKNVEISVIRKPKFPSPSPMTMDDELFNAIKIASKQTFKDSEVVGGMLSGTTDSEYLRQKGIITYGIGGSISPNAMSGIHGIDERISESELYSQLKFVYNIVRNFVVDTNKSE